MGQPPLFLQPGTAAFVERALVREQALFPAGEKTVSNSSPFAACSVMRLTRSVVSVSLASMTSETCSRKLWRSGNSSIERTSSFRFSRRPAASADLSFCHMSVYPDSSSTVWRRPDCVIVSDELRPTSERDQEIAQGRARASASARPSRRGNARLPSSARGRAGMIVQELDRGVPKAAFRHVDDALEGEIVGGLVDAAQIGEGIADFAHARKSADRRSPDKARPG